MRRDKGRKGTWLEIEQQLKIGRDPVGLGCSIHPSARLSRCVLRELGSWGRVFGRVIIIGGAEIAYMRVSGLLGRWLWAVRSRVVLTT